MDFLTFNLGKTEYAIELGKIREILVYPDNITKLPNSPEDMKGLINLRGEVVPILDLRIKFDILNDDMYNEDTTVLAIRTEDNRMLGLVADNVNDTKSLDISTKTDVGDMGTAIPPKFLKGLVQYEGNMITIIDPEAIVCKSEL